ncbi:hypothetical protein B0920_24750 [Massilia sp. KIM]|uniref:hypothetical protein n=1 Tax=Massilia sp. KIM TaxID=1955422 RepID=UPI00098FA163|nr:hypothetical protein [Massilia sp. KIM]OON59131.1 hypothetical protein B0920_24750 [Massilia sp. KIM]
MFGSTVLEVAIGLAFCYGTLALVVSTLQEALAAAFGLRAALLLDGVKRMLADPRFEALARSLYAHPLVNPQGSTGARDGRAPELRPSYIEPAHFALALVDTIREGENSVGASIAAVPDPQLRRTLQILYAQAGGELQRFQDGVAAWFDNAMQRLSGVYKRRQLLVSWLLALLLAILFNIDSIHLFRSLWQHPVLAAHITSVPAGLDGATLDQLWALPIGWTSFPPVLNADFALQVAGWLVTACTTLFGAPFWFDLLQRAINLRGTGAKPAPVLPQEARASAQSVQPLQPAEPA